MAKDSERNAFWVWYSRLAALVAGACVAYAAYLAASASGVWWTSPAAVTFITLLLGAIAPVTAFISSWAKIQLESQKQQHELTQASARQAYEIADAKTRQEHQINTDYLNRALDPQAPYALRQQLLRFLSTTPTESSSKLETWARVELARLEPIVIGLTKDIETARERVQRAQSADELASANRELQVAMERLGTTSAVKSGPPVSIPAILAGALLYQNLGQLNFSGQDLSDGDLQGCVIHRSNFSAAKLNRLSLYDADARLSSFDDADLTRAHLGQGDFRGASFRNANLTDAKLNLSRLEGADLSGATLPSSKVSAYYNSHTIWPEGFDPLAANCILVPDEGSRADEPGRDTE